MMRFSKAAVMYIASDILCMFIDLTLSVTDNPLVRAVNLVCAAGIMIIIMSSFGMKTAAEDMKNSRITGEKTRKSSVAATVCGISVIPAASWVMLLVSLSGKPDWYRWHKVLNAAFLRIYNIIEHDAESAALDIPEVFLMLPLAFIPAAAYLVAYLFVKKGIISSE